MLRINSGILGGREIATPPVNITRPVSQKIRAAIFSALGDIEGLSVIDLYAGSGALGLEALSLGAREVTFVDNSAKVTTIIRKNITSLDLKAKTKLIQRSVKNFLLNNSETYDLIFFDPPYAVFDSKTLDKALRFLSPAGVAIVSCSSKTKVPKELGMLKQIKNKSYGDTQIAYYKQS